MAITFSKSISTTKLLNSYNSNVVKFQSDSVLNATRCNINIGGFNFEITPINNVFEYDYLELIKPLVNQNEFKDSILPSADNVLDIELIKSLLVTYTILLSDGSNDVATETYNFIKSVEQIGSVTERLIAEQHILNKNNLTMFKGYPFDIARFSDGVNAVLSNVDTGISVNISSAVNTITRIWLSRGNVILTNVSPLLNVGWNKIRLAGTNQIDLNINLLDIECGTYLKWVNEVGTFSYWLFNSIHKQNLKTSTNDVVNSPSENIENTTTTKLSTGKSSSFTRFLIADDLTEYEFEQLRSIIDSPRIELYNGVYNDVVNSGSWQTINLLDGTFNVEDTKKIGNSLKIAIEINKYTQQ